MSAGVRRREDEEDVLQSMFKSFAIRQQQCQFDLAGRDDLWTVLVMLTMRKVCNAVKRQGAQLRDHARERSLEADADCNSEAILMERLADEEAPPEEVAMVSEEMQRRLEMLPDELQRIASGNCTVRLIGGATRNSPSHMITIAWTIVGTAEAGPLPARTAVITTNLLIGESGVLDYPFAS